MVEAQSDIDPYIKAQIESRQRSAVMKITLLSYRSRYPEGLIIAVEGDDDKIVYSHWIQRIIPDLAYEFFTCGGKRGVRQLRNSLHSDLGNAEKDLIFFVDRDFDDLIGFHSNKMVFMLDRYSVENYLVDPEVLDISLKVAYPGHGEPAVRQAICTLFVRDYLEFLSAATEMNKRIFIARRMRFRIDDVIPDTLSSIATVDLGRVRKCGLPAADVIPFTDEPAAEEVQKLHDEFDILIPADRYRGKFAIKFLRTWLDRLSDEYRNSKMGIFPPPIPDRAKIKHDELSMGSLACRSPIPNGLKDFLISATN